MIPIPKDASPLMKAVDGLIADQDAGRVSPMATIVVLGVLMAWYDDRRITSSGTFAHAVREGITAARAMPF